MNDVDIRLQVIEDKLSLLERPAPVAVSVVVQWDGLGDLYSVWFVNGNGQRQVTRYCDGLDAALRIAQEIRVFFASAGVLLGPVTVAGTVADQPRTRR